MDLALLGLRVDANGAIRTLNKFTGSAHNAGRATEHFERTTKNLTATLGVLGGYFGVRQLVEYADTWTLISARVRIVTESTEQMMAVQERLYRIAQRTRNTMAATSVLYTRTALNADQLGRSHEDLLRAVETVNAAMLISGATGVEAAQSMRQFAQALGAGRVQGDEFRTMMEAMPVVARTIADEMGVSFGELYKLSEDGLIDVQTVIDGLLANHEELMGRIEDMPWTIGQSFEVLNNAFVRMIGIINEAGGVSEKFGNLLRWVADNMDKLVALVGTLAAAMMAYHAAAVAARLATAALTGARLMRDFLTFVVMTRNLSAAMNMANISAKGLAGAVASIAGLVGGVATYLYLLEQIEEATRKWEEAQADLLAPMGEAAAVFDENAERTRNRIADMTREAYQNLVLSGQWAERQEELEIRFDAVNKRIEARRELTGDLRDAMIAAINTEEELALRALAYARTLEEVEDAIKEQEAVIERFTENLQRSFADVFARIFEEGIETFGDLFDSVKRIFFRMVAEMAAAGIMQKIGGTLQTVLGSAFGTTAALGALETQRAAISKETGKYLPEATAGDTSPLPVRLDDMAPEVEKSWVSSLAKYLGPALAGFGVGQLVGGMTTNKTLGTLGGAAAGALTGAAIGGPIGAVVGGLAGAVGGFLGASRKQKEEMEKLRAQMAANRLALLTNNVQLQELRDAFEGRSNRALLEAGDVASGLAYLAQLGRAPETLTLEQQANLLPIANQLGIKILDEQGRVIAGALWQLEEAIELTIRSMTQFGNNLSDLQKRQEAYNNLFDVEDSPIQQLRDQQALLESLAPELMRELGLMNLNLDSPEARDVFLEGLREIFRMVDFGELTQNPELLGAFEDKDALIDAILRAKKALDAFNKTVFDVTTDFPRAMDIAYYEQMFGSYGLEGGSGGRGGRVTSGSGGNVDRTGSWRDYFHVENVYIENNSGDSGEELLDRLERAAATRRTRGGSLDLTRRGETTF